MDIQFNWIKHGCFGTQVEYTKILHFVLTKEMRKQTGNILYTGLFSSRVIFASTLAYGSHRP